MNDERIARFIERSDNKYWGKYRGFVQNRNDSEQLGRLKLTVPSILGDAVTGWAWPVSPYAGAGVGFFFLPQVGDLVWVEFLEGELEHPLWSGCGWTKPRGTTEIPEDAQSNYPDTQVLRSRFGHVIILEDKQGSEMITVRAKNGCEIKIDPNSDLITVIAPHVVVKSDEVLIQSANESPQELATKDFVQQIFDKHRHPTAVGPTDTPDLLSSTRSRSITSVLKSE